MAQVATALMITGGILQAGSTFQQGQNSSRMATIAAGQLENNAKLAEISANNAKGASQVKAQESLRQNRLLQSKQIAIAAAGGGSVSEKSVQDIISRTAGEGRLAADVDLYEGDLRSMDYMNQAIGLRNKAMTTLYEGKQARRAANIGAISSIIGSGASASSFYGKYGNKAPNDTSSTFRQENLPNIGQTRING
jgi:hypothetical protein